MRQSYELQHVHRTGTMLLYGRNLLPEFALPLRAAHGGPADGKARLPRHIRPAHEKRGGDQPEQVHPRPVGQRKELFHQPYGEAVLGTGHAHPAGGYRKFIQGAVRPDPPEDERG